MNKESIGVLGDEALVESVAAAGAEPVTGTVSTVSDLAAVVVSGESALLELAHSGTDATVLAVSPTVSGLRSVEPADVTAACERLLADDYTIDGHSLLAAASSSTTAHALLDVTLLTAESARISEYSISLDGERLTRFRADGVVVSTPAGSSGYGRAAGGPLVTPAADSLAAAPISPFSIDSNRWVLPTDGVSLAVERDEAEVLLCVDGDAVAEVRPETPVRIDAVDRLEVAVVPESTPVF
ncbi:MAG: ATP-NAD kinase [Natronomonas sp.]